MHCHSSGASPCGPLPAIPQKTTLPRNEIFHKISLCSRYTPQIAQIICQKPGKASSDRGGFGSRLFGRARHTRVVLTKRLIEKGLEARSLNYELSVGFYRGGLEKRSLPDFRMVHIVFNKLRFL